MSGGGWGGGAYIIKMPEIKKMEVDLFFQKCRDDEIAVLYNWSGGTA